MQCVCSGLGGTEIACISTQGSFFLLCVVASIARTSCADGIKRMTKIHLLIYLSSHLEGVANVISCNKTRHVRIQRGDFLNLRFLLKFFITNRLDYYRLCQRESLVNAC